MESGQLAGPTIYTAGPSVNGYPPGNNLFVAVEDPAEFREIFGPDLYLGDVPRNDAPAASGAMNMSAPLCAFLASHVAGYFTAHEPSAAWVAVITSAPGAAP